MEERPRPAVLFSQLTEVLFAPDIERSRAREQVLRYLVSATRADGALFLSAEGVIEYGKVPPVKQMARCGYRTHQSCYHWLEDAHFCVVYLHHNQEQFGRIMLGGVVPELFSELEILLPSIARILTAHERLAK